MAIYSYTFSPYEKLASARLNALVSAINAHNHDGGAGGQRISYANLTNLSAVANTANNVVALDGSGKLPTLDGSNLTNLNVTGIPVGCILPFGGTVAPTGYLLCDGSAVSRATYSALFTVIGSSYGMGDGINTFNLPNIVDRFILGAGNRAVPGNANNNTTFPLSGTGNNIVQNMAINGYGYGSGGPGGAYPTYDRLVPYVAASHIIKY